MIKSRHIIRLVTIQAALCLLFSISSFADGYSFQNDGDQWQQRFSGTNKIYTDGIYVGEMGAIDAYMDNYGNTYNGTNIIDATAYPGAGQDDESTYNGTLSVTANDIVSSKTTVDDATVNATTTVTVNEVLTDNNLNAGVQFNNSNFNNDVTLSGSGAVNLSGSTVNNLVLGNIPQMQTLLDYTKGLYSQFRILIDNMTVDRRSTSAFTINIGDSVVTPISYNAQAFGYDTFQYDPTNNTIGTVYNIRYCNFRGSLSCSFLGISTGIRAQIESYLDRFAEYWAAYYPLKAESPLYWYAYNTDTGEYDQVNFATVFMYITWYLGKIYDDSSNVTQTMHQMTQDIGTAATTFQDLNQKEQTAIDQISQGFNSFLPDVNNFSSFRAITWCSNYLQQIYLALGSYGTVIFIALLFGVCLQFIGYFRYK